jgi:hypothetical protein
VKIEKMIAGAASYVDRTLRGALPNCLFTPTEFELVVRQKAVRNSACNCPRVARSRRRGDEEGRDVRFWRVRAEVCSARPK